MTTWRYGLASHPEFPDPLFEIDTLAALEEEGTAPHLLLADRADPPGVRANRGDDLLLCIRRDVGSPYAAAARAWVEGPATRREVPAGHDALYERVEGLRWWLPVSIEKFPALRAEDDVGLARDVFQARGQAGVWRLQSVNPGDRIGNPPALLEEAIDGDAPAELPKLLIRPPEPTAAIGVDLTAGDPATAFEQGKKPFWAVHARAGTDGLLLDEPALVSTLTELEGAIRKLSPNAVVIDGPCGANGIRLNPAQDDWVPNNPGVRSAERELSRKGIKLFWTTEATLRSFSGAREWILRSLVLFGRLEASGLAADSTRPLRALETHPHAFSSFFSGAPSETAQCSHRRSHRGGANSDWRCCGCSWISTARCCPTTTRWTQPPPPYLASLC